MCFLKFLYTFKIDFPFVIGYFLKFNKPSFKNK